jgi:prevent-host-death family protein
MAYMLSIPSTEAKNRFGELLAAVGDGPVSITRNGRPVAYIIAADEAGSRGLDKPAVKRLIADYANGRVTRARLQEETGLSFGEVLLHLAAAGLPLPVVRTIDRFTPKQRKLYDQMFAPPA